MLLVRMKLPGARAGHHELLTDYCGGGGVLAEGKIMVSLVNRRDARQLRRVRNFAEVKNHGVIDQTTAAAALTMVDVDEAGFDYMDRKLLLAIIEKFMGGPVGLENLAAAIGEEKETIEDVLEPYLIQQGFLQRTPRGRVATPHAYAHFGLRMSNE